MVRRWFGGRREFERRPLVGPKRQRTGRTPGRFAQAGVTLMAYAGKGQSTREDVCQGNLIGYGWQSQASLRDARCRLTICSVG